MEIECNQTGIKSYLYIEGVKIFIRRCKHGRKNFSNRDYFLLYFMCLDIMRLKRWEKFQRNKTVSFCNRQEQWGIKQSQRSTKPTKCNGK